MCLIFLENEDIMYEKSLFLACFWSLKNSLIFRLDGGKVC